MPSSRVFGFAEIIARASEEQKRLNVECHRAVEDGVQLGAQTIRQYIEQSEPPVLWPENAQDYAEKKQELLGESRLLMATGEYSENWQTTPAQSQGDTISAQFINETLTQDTGELLGPMLEDGVTWDAPRDVILAGHVVKRQSEIPARPHLAPAFEEVVKFMERRLSRIIRRG